MTGEKVMFDEATKRWFEEHPGAQTTVCRCERCLLYYKEALGHRCRIFVQPCEMGEPVFLVVTKVSGKTGKPFSFVKKSRLTENNFFRVASGWGKTAFPSWQEAEAARKKMVQNGDVVDGV